MTTQFNEPVPAIDGIRVGIGGWTYVPWRGLFYPQGLVQRRELEYASRQLSAIEINGTYYGAQKPATYARWRDETPDGFVFSAKAPKRITGARALSKSAGAIEDFIGGIASLGDRLGPLVWQFEKGRRIDRNEFEGFVELLPTSFDGRRLRHVLDVRDPEFVDARFLQLARSRGLATVFTDSTEHPSFADVTSDFVYARLMRSQADIVSGYAPEDLARWGQRARTWARGEEPADLPRIEPQSASDVAKPREVFLFFISAAKERNPAAATALLAALGAR